MTDKKTIGLTPAGERAIARLMEQGWFKDRLDAARLAMAVAIRAGDVPRAVEGANTIWNVGSFDADGQMRQILPVLYPNCKTPYRAAESLVDRGLQRLAEQLEAGGLDVVAVLRGK